MARSSRCWTRPRAAAPLRSRSREAEMRWVGSSHTMITKINVVPIIDVSLVLVIILLVTAPLLSVADLPVDLPQARTREAEDERNVSITLGTTGRIAVDDVIIAEDALMP